MLTGAGERGVGGAKSYDGEKAWSSVNHSILSARNASWCVVVEEILAKSSKIVRGKE